MFATHPVSPALRLLDTAEIPTPSPAALAEVEALWSQALTRVPGLFDGKVFSLARLEGDTAAGFMAPYKWYLAQLARPKLHEELRVRSVALNGLVIAGGHLMFGLRKPTLAVEPGLWETVPTGTLDATLREPDGSVSWRLAFARELREELGLDLPEMAARPFAMVENTSRHTIETGIVLEIDMDHRDVLAAYISCDTPEHTEMAAVPLADVPRFLTERPGLMTAGSAHLAAALGIAPAP